MNSNDQIARIVEVIQKNQSGVIITPPNPLIDTVASATALYLFLNKLGKNATLACSSEIKINELTAADKFINNLNVSGNSLMISFPYNDGSIDKVDYNIQGDFFNLVITPRPGYKKLNSSQVKFSYTGGKIDFFIILDSPNLNNLGEIYLNNKDKFTGCEIINIDRHLINNNFGTINYVKKTAASLSEIVFEIMEKFNVDIDKEIATNLYAGIINSTNNFTSYSTTAETLEKAAKLLRLGAIKKIIKSKSSSTFESTVEKAIFNFPKEWKTKPKVTSTFPTKETTPIENVEKEKIEPQTPQDWLKPKIFRGGGLL